MGAGRAEAGGAAHRERPSRGGGALGRVGAGASGARPQAGAGGDTLGAGAEAAAFLPPAALPVERRRRRDASRLASQLGTAGGATSAAYPSSAASGLTPNDIRASGSAARVCARAREGG